MPSTDQTRETCIEQLELWLQEKAAWVNETVKVKDTLEEGFGLFWTGSSTGENELLVQIPQENLINLTNVQEYSLEEPGLFNILNSLKDIKKEELNERETITSFLIYERFLRKFSEVSNQKESPWKPYIDILPKKSCTPVFYKQQARDWLQGTAVGEATEAKIKRLDVEYQRFLKVLTEEASLEFEEFAWADNMYWSRVISFQSAVEDSHIERAGNSDDCHLVPFIDLCNHSLTPSAHWQITEDGINLVQMGELLETDTEIHISYGDKPNSELLYLHGFIIPENPYTRYILPLPLIPDELLGSKMNFLKAFQIKPQLVLTPEDLVDLTEDTWQLLYLCMVNEEDGFDEDEARNLCYRNNPVSTVQEIMEIVDALPHYKIIQLRAVTVLLDVINSALHQLLETNPLEGEEVPGELQLVYEYVLTYREEEMDFLENLLQTLSDRQQKLIDNEQVQEYLAFNQ
ncbi:hypothetical protein K7432_012183 [Basidiobolus ranarum]|uniref:SET domain-containing protein n=1 Tax=Basidiobolus ranarum TaxID=34480 RepID=A0ABR2VTI5_9FUNG